ncbi:MAG: hypothetical protein LBI48_01715 [Burkholderiaceae bacterium]|nr:hypothetical protein [Burkholderiaceae bacterium]
MRENVVKDIMYLNSLIGSGSLASERKEAAQAEWNITVPKDTDKPAQDALCGKDGQGNQLNYWSSLKDSATQPVCQSNTILAIADFTDPNGAGEMRYLSAVA